MRTRLPVAAAAVLSAVGVASLAVAVVLVLFPLPGTLGYPVPSTYRYVLVGLALAGGVVHLAGGWWAWHRRWWFRSVLATLVGMALLQVSVPLDLVALACLGLGRDAFDS